MLQLADALRNGYWHARGPEFLNEGIMRTIEWVRMPGDLVFSVLGVVPIVLAAALTYRHVKKSGAKSAPVSSTLEQALPRSA